MLQKYNRATIESPLNKNMTKIRRTTIMYYINFKNKLESS